MAEERNRFDGRSWRMSRREVLLGAATASVAALPVAGRAARVGAAGTADAPSPLDYPDGPFASSTASFAHRLNEYWAIYGTAQGTPETQRAHAAGALSTMGLNPAWDEWDAMKFAWTTHRGNQAVLMSGLASDTHRVNGVAGATGAQPDGYLWSWSTVETWPDGNAGHDGLGSYHFDQLPRFVTAVSQLANWTRNASFRDAISDSSVSHASTS